MTEQDTQTDTTAETTVETPAKEGMGIMKGVAIVAATAILGPAALIKFGIGGLFALGALGTLGVGGYAGVIKGENPIKAIVSTARSIFDMYSEAFSAFGRGWRMMSSWADRHEAERSTQAAAAAPVVEEPAAPVADTSHVVDFNAAAVKAAPKAAAPAATVEAQPRALRR